MKKYKRRLPSFSLRKTGIATLCMVLVTVLILIFGESNIAFIFGTSTIVPTGFTLLVFVHILCHQYRYSDTCIDILYHSLPYRKLKYSSYSTIVISNANYSLVYNNLPVQYKVKGHTKVTFPFITLLKPDYPAHKIKDGMNDRDLYILRNDEMYCLGICWFDSLKELLNHTNCPVYVLEDVYLRYKGMFDSIFTQHKNEMERFFIIIDHKIEYNNYLRGLRL